MTGRNSTPDAPSHRAPTRWGRWLPGVPGGTRGAAVTAVAGATVLGGLAVAAVDLAGSHPDPSADPAPTTSVDTVGSEGGSPHRPRGVGRSGTRDEGAPTPSSTEAPSPSASGGTAGASSADGSSLGLRAPGARVSVHAPSVDVSGLPSAGVDASTGGGASHDTAGAQHSPTDDSSAPPSHQSSSQSPEQSPTQALTDSADASASQAPDPSQDPPSWPWHLLSTQQPGHLGHGHQDH